MLFLNQYNATSCKVNEQHIVAQCIKSTIFGLDLHLQQLPVKTVNIT